MKRRFKKFLLVSTAFSYGFLGCGPSLWSLGVSPPDPVMDCLRMGCSCRLHPGKGGACCCLANRALIRKFPELASDRRFWKALGLDPPSPQGTCQMHGDQCPLGGASGPAPPLVQQAHWPVEWTLHILLLSALQRPSFIETVPQRPGEAPDPVPD